MGNLSSALPATARTTRVINGRLLGVTATGPVYMRQRTYAVVPLFSAFALLQELAVRVEHPEATVQSSLASRVSRDSAYQAWRDISIECAMQLERVTVRGRLRFLSIVLQTIRSSGRVDGLEPILASAVNATWPWLSRETTHSVLELASNWLRKSEFAHRHPIPVIDLSNRTAGIFAPGEVAKLDIGEWRASRDLALDGVGGLPVGVDGKLGDVGRSPLERAIDDLFGGSSSSAEDLIAAAKGGDSSGVPGGMPSKGDLPGGQHGSKSGGGSQNLDDIAAGLMDDDHSGVPGGLPSMGDMPGAKKPGGTQVGKGHDQLGGMLDSIPGAGGYRGISGFIRRHGAEGFRTGLFPGATPGGPLAPPGQLGIHGAEGPYEDGVRDVAAGVAVLGAGILAIAAAPVTIAVGVGAAAVGLAGGALIGLGGVEMVRGTEERDRPEPPKEKPHPGDLYPDPMGGGGGNPTQLPDFDGAGGGGPAWMPDQDDHGGGTPNTIWGKTTEGTTIWDENFGGPGPTVKPGSITVAALVGPGLMADVVQIGPRTLRF